MTQQERKTRLEIASQNQKQDYGTNERVDNSFLRMNKRMIKWENEWINLAANHGMEKKNWRANEQRKERMNW